MRAPGLIFARRLLVSCLLAGLTCVPLTARAEEPPTIDEAREAFLEGRTLMENQQWNEAALKFAYAALAKNTPGLRYHVGYCQEQAGKLVEARVSYTEAQELLASQPAADVEKLIPEALQRVEAAMPFLSVTGLPEGAALFVDGEATKGTSKLALNPGAHVLMATADGFETWEGTVTLTPGQTEIVAAEMVPTTPAASPAPVESEPAPATVEDQPRSNGARRAVFWTGVGVGTAGLATGVVGTVLFLNAKGQLSDSETRIDEISDAGDSACYEPSGELTQACDDLSSAGKKSDTGRVLMIAGYATAGVGLATALLAHFLWDDAAAGSIQVHAHAAPGESFVGLSGRF